MFTKIVLVAVVVAIVTARPQPDRGHIKHHGHGHAISLQSVVLHNTHGNKLEPHHEEHPKKHDEHHEEHHHDQQNPHEENHLHGHHIEKYVDYYAYPKYEFSYKVDDAHTGDKKSQHESRDGHVVKGVYSLHEPDGTIRIVEYYSDKGTGFNANVKHEGHVKHMNEHHH